MSNEKLFKMFSILYLTCVSFVIVVSSAVNRSDYALGDQNIMRDDQKDINQKSEDIKLIPAPIINQVRCFCNLPVCAVTNFMCSTNNQTGGCFSEIHQSDTEVGLPKRHGCIEFLKKSTSDLVCDNIPRKHVLAPQFGEILVLCCQDTMCNYQHYEANQKSRDTTTTMMTSNNNDVYFKIAVIIVPILGIIIVALLIILAIKMLKSDGIDSQLKPSIDNLGQTYKVPGPGGYGVNSMMHHHHHHVIEDGLTGTDNDTHVVSLLCGHQNATTTTTQIAVCDKKNENLAVRNQLMSLEYRLLPNSYQDSNIKLLNTEEGVLNNIYSKNFKAPPICGGTTIKQNISNESKNGDKIYDKELLNPVVVNWKSNIRNKINIEFNDKENNHEAEREN
uniref:CSON001088 protein n=1 Tax=Culicoides sonorensis TaxID=179676 RepID=A0A336MK85_CULSO